MKKCSLCLALVMGLLFQLNSAFGQNESGISLSVFDEIEKLFDAGEHKQGRESLTELSKKPETKAEAHHRLARMYIEQGQYAKAIEEAKLSIKHDDKNPDFFYWLGMACVYRIDELESTPGQNPTRDIPVLAVEAKKAVEEALDLEKNHLKANVLSGRLFLYCPPIIGGSVKKAKRIADDVLEIDEREGRLLWAEIYEEEEEFDKAEEEYRILKEMEEEEAATKPKDDVGEQDVHFSYAQFLINRKDYSKAVEEYEAILKRDPKNHEAHYRIGRIHFEEGYYSMAIQSFRKSIQSYGAFLPARKFLKQANRKNKKS